MTLNQTLIYTGKFCTTAGKESAEFALFPDKLSLHELYCHRKESQVMEKVQEDTLRTLQARRNGKELSEEMDSYMKSIEVHLKKYGSDFDVNAINIDGECERELEQEVEMELEKDKRFLRTKPRNEMDWEYGLIFSAVEYFNEILDSSEASSITNVIRDHFNPEIPLIDVPWRDNVYCTKNFIMTVSLPAEGPQYIEDLLRPVDAFIYFEDCNSILLLSEREADKILPLMWELRSRGAGRPVRFMHLAYAKEAHKIATITSDSDFLSCFQEPIDAMLITLLQLFNGETTYRGMLEEALKEILCTKEAKIAAKSLPYMRGLEHLLRGSKLEDLCTY